MDRTGIADYEFVRTLGDGSHGCFYLANAPARIRADSDHVAVKVLGMATSGDAFRRMTRELKVFASVRSPYLVRLYDAGQERDTFYYSMEYHPLGSLAAPARPLTADEVLRAVADAARAAHDLHEAGVAHRSIKPANILLHDDGAKLSDLGLAQILAPGQTVTGLGGIGSVEYVDPEIMRGEQASRASDIWSLGITLHRSLTGIGVYGELPDSDPLLAIRKVINTEPVLDGSLSPGARELIAACLAPDPADRVPTALVVAERIDALRSSS